MNKETWGSISNFENYQVSNFGRVKRKYKNGNIKILKNGIDKDGYYIVSLCFNNKKTTKRVNILVAQAFIPNPNNYPVVNHINGIKTDNRVENLEWCTKKYNRNYGTAIARAKSKISQKNKGRHFSPQTEFKKGDNAKKIKCIELNKKYNSIIEASLELNICAVNIVNVCKHKKHNKTAGGYHFEYD